MVDSTLLEKIMRGTKGICIAQRKVFSPQKLNINSEQKETVKKKKPHNKTPRDERYLGRVS